MCGFLVFGGGVKEDSINACGIKIERKYYKAFYNTDWDRYMINYDEEIKKFSPSLEVDETEDAIYNSNIKDITDVVLEMVKEMKENN